MTELFSFLTVNYLHRQDAPTVWSKHLDYAAFSNAPAGAVGDHAFQLHVQLHQALDPSFNLTKLGARNGNDRFA